MSTDNREQILNKLKQIKSDWQEKKLFLEGEKVKTDSPGRKFELKKEIQECDEEIKKITEEIESLSSQIQTNLSPVKKNNYTQLEILLAQEKWKEADYETKKIMLEVSGRKVQGWIDKHNIIYFPCEDIKKIDLLWLKYSNGRFGFSAQIKVYLTKINSAGNFDEWKWEELGNYVGWRENETWLKYSQINFKNDENTPVGYLPIWVNKVYPDGIPFVGGGQGWWISFLARACNCLPQQEILSISKSEYLSFSTAKTYSNINQNRDIQMKRITWLHLSDWHQKGEDFGRQVVRDKLIEDIQKCSEINSNLANIDFIVFSGDLAHSGNQKEYEAAKQYLLKPVLEATGLSPDRIFFVPGNHDFDRSKKELLPPGIQNPFQSENDVNEWLTDLDKRNEILKPFRAYKEFITKYNNQNQPEYASVQILEINNKKVGLLGLNSALMCARNEDANGEIADQGFLVVGEPQIYTSLQSIKDCEIKIAVLHHPFDWLTEFDRRRIKRPLGEGCHFILCGHEHQSRVERVSATDGDYVFIPAGASYDRSNFPNSYNFVHLNFEKTEGIVYLRKWSRDRTKWIKNEDAYDNGQFVILSLPKQLSQISAPK